MERQFKADGPDPLWVADITYIPTRSGFLYLAIVLDVWSRKIVGWAMQTHLRTELVLEALNTALMQRRPNQVIHHSGHGCQYTSYAVGKRCREMNVMPSLGSVGDAYDNAMAESFFATLERELLDRRCFRTQAEGKLAVFEWLEGWHNPHRRHSSLGRISPVNFERRHLNAQAAWMKGRNPSTKAGQDHQYPSALALRTSLKVGAAHKKGGALSSPSLFLTPIKRNASSFFPCG